MCFECPKSGSRSFECPKSGLRSQTFVQASLHTGFSKTSQTIAESLNYLVALRKLQTFLQTFNNLAYNCKLPFLVLPSLSVSFLENKSSELRAVINMTKYQCVILESANMDHIWAPFSSLGLGQKQDTIVSCFW